MARGQRIVILVLVGFLAILLLAGLGYVLLGNRAGSQPDVIAAQVPVVVALQPLTEGDVITAEHVGIQMRDAASIPSGAVTRLQDAMGHSVGRPVQGDEILLITDLTTLITGQDQGPAGPLDGTLSSEWVAVAIQAPDLWSQWGVIQPGDHLDVLATMEIPLVPEPSLLPPDPFATMTISLSLPSSEQVIVWTIQDLEVLEVTEEPLEETVSDEEDLLFVPAARRLLVLKATPQDGAILHYLQHAEATIDLVLRARQNSRKFDVDSVTLDYLLRRYSPELESLRP